MDDLDARLELKRRLETVQLALFDLAGEVA